MDSEWGLRVRAALAEWYTPVIALCLIVALLGGWLTYTAYAGPGTTVERQPGPTVSTTGAYDYAAVVSEPNPLYPVDTTLSDQPFYFYSVSPELQGEFTYRFDATNGGQLDVRATTSLVKRSVDGGSGGTVYWQRNRTLADREATIGPGGAVTVPFSLNVTAAEARARAIENGLGGSPGGLELLLVTQVRASGQANGQEVTRTRSYQLPLSPEATGYSVPYEGPVTDERSQPVTVTVQRSYGPPWTLGGPLALLAGVGGLTALVLADRRDELGVTEAERRRLAAASAREEYDDWITTARLPEAATDGPTVEVDSLEGLVDLAIDTDERVLESFDGTVYRVLHDGYVYAYRQPEAGSPEASTPGSPLTPESTAPRDSDSTVGPAGDGGIRTSDSTTTPSTAGSPAPGPTSGSAPEPGASTPAVRETTGTTGTGTPDPSPVEFGETEPAVRPAPRPVSFEGATAAVERSPEPDAVDPGSAAPAVTPAKDPNPRFEPFPEAEPRGEQPEAGPAPENREGEREATDLRGLVDGEDLTAVPELGAADAERLASVGFPTLAALARAEPSTVAEATGVTPGYAEQVIDSAAELTREAPPVAAVKGVGETYAAELREAGIETVADLAAVEPTFVAGRTSIPGSLAETLVERASDAGSGADTEE